MECLFRHIRKTLAHNRTYQFENGNILLEDVDDNEKVSARILLSKRTLLDWIDIIAPPKQVTDIQNDSNG